MPLEFSVVLIGVPREIKVHEYRVGLTPESVARLAGLGHEVLVETGAGAGIGADDAAYAAAGARIALSAEAVFAGAQLIVKVKEPLAPERARLRPGQVLFTYLHLAPDEAQARELMASGVTAIAYETVTGPGGGLPLLAPMSGVAGRMAAQVAAHWLEKPAGGRGVLMGGAAGAPCARVLVLGAGVVGTNAARVALGMGARVTVLNRTGAALDRLRAGLDAAAGERLATGIAEPERIAALLRDSDALIGAALVPGAMAPRLVSREMIAMMPAGAVAVDVSIDQGGCFETSRPTTHAEPVYLDQGVIHYCVANMPGAVPRTSAYALNAATLPFVERIASLGAAAALRADPHLLAGLNVHAGRITRPEVAAALGIAASDPLAVLEPACR